MIDNAVIRSISTGYKASVVLLVVTIFVIAVHFLWNIVQKLLTPNIKLVRKGMR